MTLLTRAANTTLMLGYAPAHARLLTLRTAGQLRDTQEAILRATLRRNADTEFGRAHGFARINSVRTFRSAVPPTTWDAYAAASSRVAQGVPGVLTAEPVRLLEPSSGSTAATKLVPYTKTLQAEFQRGIAPWLHDLYTSFPGLRRGRSYWSITPPGQALADLRARHAGSGVPIGFDEDADYLGPIAKRLVTSLFAVPAEVAQTTDTERFLDDTCVHLLAADDVAFISVWNPTLFLLLLDRMTERAADYLPRLTASRRRDVAGPLRAGDWPRVWPQLTLVSAWADAGAGAAASKLRERLGVPLQPKGLLATEGFVSLPIEAAGGAVLAGRSHFVEFEPEHEPGHALMAHELEIGGRYGVILTTGGGLYRYRLGDGVEVSGRFGALPVLRFVGRLDQVSDLVGEKLNAVFVTETLTRLAPGTTLRAAVDHYELAGGTPAQAARVDDALRANFHYDHARRLGQLGAVAAVPAENLLNQAGRRGARLGDLKASSLDVGVSGVRAQPLGAAGVLGPPALG